LAALAGATSMLDISDGLVLDARRIARASGVAFDLSSQAVLAAAADTLRFALDGGEDHSLLATFPSASSLPEGFSPLGAVVAPTSSRSALLLVDGRAYNAAGGWDPYEGWLGARG
jgi:thiamine-monophosphate kinase